MTISKFRTAILFCSLGLGAALLPGGRTIAQEMPQSLPSPEEVVAKLDSKLSLTADQKAKITPIIADRQSKIKALQADTSTPRVRKMRNMKQIMEESDTKIKATLTDDQKKKYDEMQQEMRDKMQEHRQEKQQSAPPQQ